MKKKYETRDKIIKWFTILVIFSFLVTVVGSGIVAFMGNNSTSGPTQAAIGGSPVSAQTWIDLQNK